MSHSLLVSTSLYYVSALGIGSESDSWYLSVSRCQRCTRRVTHQQGVLCANFGHPVLGLPECRSAWWVTCYSTLPGDNFLICRETDEEGRDMTAPGDETDFLYALPGDHLFCPFEECDTCTFLRLKRTKHPDPKSRTDSLLLVYLRRANLDAFWSRRPGTVEGMWRLFFAQAEVGNLFGFEMFDRILGPALPHDYDSGMWSAIGSLWQSQRPDRHETKQIYSSVRKVRSLHTNIHSASAKSASSTLVWRS